MGGGGGSGGTTGTGVTTATGGTTAMGGTCAQSPIDATQAAAIYADYSIQAEPGLTSWATFAAEEKSVPSLWEAMQAQLFNAKTINGSGTAVRECSFLYRDCAVTLPNEDCNPFGLIVSGVVANGAFYYSWVVGSGISHSILGKLAPDGAALARTISYSYTNASLNPPNLVVALENGQVVVYRATVDWEHFNDWQNPERMGTLKDFGDRLGILDSNGQELEEMLP